MGFFNHTKPESAAYILTLRYNPLSNAPLTKLSSSDFEPKSTNTSSSQIKKFIEQSIIQNLENEKKIALSLSGGVDSTLVLGVIRKTLPDLQIDTISVKFSNSTDETTNALKTAQKLECNSHIVSIDNYLEELPMALSIVKQPFWDLHWYYVVKKAKDISFSTLVSGDGGDELFGGYIFRYEKFLSLITPDSSPQDKVIAYLQCHERDHVPDQKDIFKNKIGFSWDKIYEFLLPYFNNNLSLIDQVFLADYNGKLLYNFSTINSSISNHFKIKSFSPILSKELISYATHIPNLLKYNPETKIGKIPLRNILNEIGLNSLVTKQKLGFSLNTINYWKLKGHKICQDYLSESRVVRDGWINSEWIDKYIDKDNLDVRYVNKFLGLLSFEIWYRLFITKEIHAKTLLS